jgi:cytoskeletal protein CcmA (bactofilin family)
MAAEEDAPMPKLTRSLWLGLALAASLGSALPAGEAEAADSRAGTRVRVESGETVAGDLYAAGLQVVIDGHVTGDLVVAGGSVEVRGRVDGALIGAAGKLVVHGPVGRAVRVFGSEVTLDGPIGGDLLGAAGGLTTTPAADVGGESRVRATDLRLSGRLGRALTASGTDVALSGEVAGPARLVAPALAIAPPAHVAGPLTLETASLSPVRPGARVDGPVTVNPWVSRAEWRHLLGWLLGLLAAFWMGLACLWLVPDAVELTGALAVRIPGWRFLLGLGVLIGVPFLAIMLLVTVLGLPLGLMLLGVYLAALYLAPIVVAWSLGRFLLRRRRGVETHWKQALALGVGLLVVYGAKALPLMGDYLSFAITLWGLGALGALAYGGYVKRHPGAGPAEPPETPEEKEGTALAEHPTA